ncbi:hypothetical protein OAG57_05040 [Akkermansiaceae bacterium]|nr:hypothetical protein [Akkermansiaceae bacterium]
MPRNIKRIEGGSLQKNYDRKQGQANANSTNPYRIGLGLQTMGYLPINPAITIRANDKPTTVNQQMKQLQSGVMNIALKTWEDRNTDNIGTKLNNTKPLLGITDVTVGANIVFDKGELENHKGINRDNAVRRKLDTKDKKAFKSRGGK